MSFQIQLDIISGFQWMELTPKQGELLNKSENSYSENGK